MRIPYVVHGKCYSFSFKWVVAQMSKCKCIFLHKNTSQVNYHRQTRRHYIALTISYGIWEHLMLHHAPFMLYGVYIRNVWLCSNKQRCAIFLIDFLDSGLFQRNFLNQVS